MSLAPNPENDRGLPWWAAVLLVVLGFGGMLAAMAAAALLVQGVAHVSYGEALHRVQSDLLDIGMAQALGFTVAIVAGARLFAPELRLRDALLVHPVASRKIAFAFVAGLALQFPLAELGNLVSILWPMPLEERLRMQALVTPRSTVDAIMAFFTIVLVAPVSEELLFRGLLFRGLFTRYGSLVAVLFTAILFGISHGFSVALIFATAAGLLFGGVAHRTGSVAPTMAMHMAVNATPLLLPPSLVSISGFNVVTEQVTHVPLPLVIGAAIVGATAMAMVIAEEREEA